MAENLNETAGGRYQNLEATRRTFLDRARDAAKLTIPTLIPPDGHSSVTKYYTPFQGIGARGVNNLASKLLLALLPPNSPFFRLTVDDFTLMKLTNRQGMRAEVEKALNQIERAVMSEIEGSAIRVSAFEALKHLIVAGNALVYLPPEGGMRVFRLDRFVVSRDPMGNVLEIITKEDVAPAALPESIRKVVEADTTHQNGSVHRTVELFTWVRREADKWTVHQEVKGAIIPGSKGTYPLDKTPWIPLRFTKIDGEDYGRGYVEEYYGDLRSLEGLTEAIVEGSAAAAKVLFLVNPNGTTDLRTLSDSPNGAIRTGNAQDVSVLQMDKFADFRIAFQTIELIQQRLSFAFLLNTAIQRAGERVTAEEIRFMAGELEDALGGVYSILSQEFQLPLVNRLMHQMERQRKMPALPKGIVRPTITTGLEALGRGHDLNKLQSLLNNLAPLGPEAVATYLNVGDYITRAGTALGIDMAGLVKTEEEVQQQMQMQQMQQMVEKLGPKGMDIVRDQVKPEAQPQ
jgi:hypothetical protein